MGETVELYPPGELIREELEARGWTQQRLADAMGKSHVLVSEIVNAKRSITEDTALALATVLGTSAEVWLNLDARYQLALKQQRAVPSGRELRAVINSKVPLRAMIKRGWARSEDDMASLEQQVLAFTEQSSLRGEWVFAHHAKRSNYDDSLTPEQFVWLCRARQLARITEVRGKWKQSSATDLVHELQRLIQSAPALQDVPRVLSEFGIRLVVVERLPGMKMDGATFRLDDEPDQPVIALALRYDRIDNAWHTIMHECAHIIEDELFAVDEEVLKRGETRENELRADAFAVNNLVPQDKLDDFCRRVAPMYSEVRIVGFANLHRVHPGIVVGQLHHRGRENRGLDYTHFRKLLTPVRDFIINNTTTDGWGKVVPADLTSE